MPLVLVRGQTIRKSAAQVRGLPGKVFGHHERVVILLQRLAGPRGNVTYLRNPLDQILFRSPKVGEREAERNKLGWHTNRLKVLFVGRLIERKGIDLLLAAKDPAYDLVFCGPSILTKHLGDGVTYIPPRSPREIISLYHAADVLPSVLGTDPGLAIYQQCKGLTFWALRVGGAAVR